MWAKEKYRKWMQNCYCHTNVLPHHTRGHHRNDIFGWCDKCYVVTCRFLNTKRKMYTFSSCICCTQCQKMMNLTVQNVHVFHLFANQSFSFAICNIFHKMLFTYSISFLVFQFLNLIETIVWSVFNSKSDDLLHFIMFFVKIDQMICL